MNKGHKAMLCKECALGDYVKQEKQSNRFKLEYTCQLDLDVGCDECIRQRIPIEHVSGEEFNKNIPN